MAGNIWIKPTGNMGNRALQYLVAHGIAAHAPGVKILNVNLPEWGMDSPHPEPPIANSITTPTNQFDVPGLGDCLNRNVIETVILDGNPYHMDHYPPRAAARKLIGPAAGAADVPGFGPHQLVCSLRGAEIINAIHPDYLLLPPAYYEMLAARSGLDLVFFGQIGDDLYTQSLRRKFPHASFVHGKNAQYDFEMLRRSANIAPSISTFAWLAAWLSEAEKIYLPVCGIFNPVQLSYRLFLPLDDPSYEYTLFPYSRAVNVHKSPAEFALAQDHLAAHARPIGVSALREICQRTSILYNRAPLLSQFDKTYYEQRYPDIAAAVQAGLPSALHHYLHAGFLERRQPFAIDPVFYVTSYPDAAMQIAEGFFADPLHHYLAAGHAKGYQPTP